MNTMTTHPARAAGVSFACHLATTSAYFSKHAQCDGRSYTASIVDKGTPCTCTCHSTGGDKP